MISCRNCHNELPDGSIFCNMCGNKIKITCRNCGNEMPDGSIFCNMCGSKKSSLESDSPVNKIAPDINESSSPVKTTQTTNQSKNMVILIVVLSILSIVMVNFLASKNVTPEIKDSTDAQVNQTPEISPQVNTPTIPLLVDSPDGYLWVYDDLATFIRFRIEDNQISGQWERIDGRTKKPFNEINQFTGTVDGENNEVGSTDARYGGVKITITFNSNYQTFFSGRTMTGFIADNKALFLSKPSEKNYSIYRFEGNVQDYNKIVRNYIEYPRRTRNGENSN